MSQTESPTRKKKSRIVPGLVTLGIIVGGLAYLFYSSAGEAFEYYKHVDEVMVEPVRWEGKHLQVHGFVVPDSIKKRLDKEHQQVEYKFKAINCGSELDVHYAGTVPDTFKDKAEVVVKGTLKGPLFMATEISAKCPSKYDQKVDGVAATMCTKGDKNVGAPQAAAVNNAP
jgi:cytochrome c-type biogenesis protein CcmE